MTQTGADLETNDFGPPRKDPWAEYTIEKLSEMLTTLELAQDDRNGSFTAIGIVGALFIGSAWWHVATSQAGGWTDAAGFALGIILVISGVALRINGHLDTKRLRRMQKLLNSGKYRL